MTSVATSSLSLAPVPTDAGLDPQVVVDRITGAAQSSFSLGMKLLARPRRRAMRAVYAFCRVVDDIADGDLDASEKHRLLDAWRAEIAALYDGRPVSAVGQALIRPVDAYGLPSEEFLSLIDGMAMDADGPIVAPSRDDLALYTRRVAGTVGMLSMRIFGAWRGDVSRRFALSLADALQLTNILRDVEEDAAIGRLYLPAETLARHGVPADAARVEGHDALPAVCAEIGQEARHAFTAARANIGAHSRVSLAPALAMLGVYERYLDMMEAQNWQRSPAVRLSSLQKLRYGLQALAISGPRH